jgi:hypothetical protein
MVPFAADGIDAKITPTMPSLGYLAKGAWFAGTAGMGRYYILALSAFALSIREFIEIDFLRGQHRAQPIWLQSAFAACRQRLTISATMADV